MKKRLYLAIIERLKGLNLGIKHFSLWNNDVYSLTKAKAFAVPAVFVEFEDIDWTQLMNRARSAQVRIKLHILTATYATPEDGNPKQEQALECLDLTERIVDGLIGLDGHGFNSLMHVYTHTDHDHEEVWDNEETFITQVTAKSQRQVTTVTGADLSIGKK